MLEDIFNTVQKNTESLEQINVARRNCAIIGMAFNVIMC